MKIIKCFGVSRASFARLVLGQLAAVCSLAAFSLSAASFTNGGAITIPLQGTGSPYPSSLTVSGLQGTVTKVTASLNQLTHTYPDDIDVLLVAPGGQKSMLMSTVGGANGVTGVNLTLDDAAAASLPDSAQIVSGTFKPTTFGSGSSFTAPAPAGPYTASMANFNGATPNGVWTLYVVDHGPGDQGNFGGGWSVNIFTTGSNAPPTISAVAAQATLINTPTPAIPFTVSDVETPASNLVVSAQSSNPALAPTNNFVFGGSGANRTVTITPVAGQTGSATITLTVRDASAATTSTSFLLTVTPAGVGGTFNNSGAITIPLIGNGSPYPSTINVSGVAGTITKVTVMLNQLTHTYPDDIDILLVGPGGQKVIVMSDVGGGGALNNVTLTFDDAASSSLASGAQIVSGTYKPSNVGANDTFSSPAPAGPYAAALSAFSNTVPNGAWSLYVLDDGPGDQGMISGGWSLTITTPAPTNSAPAITGQPASQTVAVGANPVFSVVASGTAPLNYQWRVGGGALSGATAATLNLTNVQLADAGNYDVIVTNSLGSITSSVAVLTVLTPPAITGQPQSATNVTGSIAVLSATASGSPTLGFRWRLNGTALTDSARISGSTTTSLSISNLQFADAGNYTLFVSNAVGSVTSSVASLTVNGPPLITGQPANQTVAVGANPTFTVIASGTAPLSYQWQLGGSDIGGATGSALTLSNVQTTDGGNYTVTITNSAGSATSSVAVLTVLTPPGIIAQPQSATNLAGTMALFSATASGSPTLGYRWRLNGVGLNDGPRISGSSSTSLTVSNVQAADAGNYTLFVTNAVGSITSAVAALTVISPPSITGQPASQSASVGASVNFSVTASGTAPLSYAWQFNGAAIAGGTASNLTVTNVQPTNGGSYSVVVTNIAGSATSSVAVLTVSTQTTFASFTNSGAITIPLMGNASPYPSTITVSGLGATITKATVKLNQLSHTYPDDIDVLLVAPGGQKSVLMSYVGGANGLSGVSLTFDDAAAASLPDTAQIVSGTFKPTAIGTGAAFPAPAPAGPYTAALANFNGASPNGVWSLYVVDHGPGDQGTIAGGWSLNLSTAAPSNSPPSISGQPANLSVIAGSNASFTVTASGTAPLNYQWQKGGVNLSDGANVSGATSSALALSSVQTNDSGSSYRVIVANGYGSITSSVATLTVTAPGNCLGSAPAGLIGWWPGEGNANDIAGSDNGSLGGGATATAPGIVGAAFTFDGTNGLVQIPDVPLLRPTNLTIETWVRFNSLNSAGNGAPAGSQYMVFHQNSRTSGQFEGYDLHKTRLSPNDYFEFIVTSSAGASVSVVSATAIQAGIWYHVAATRGPNYIQIFVNGKLERQASVSFAQDYGPFPLYFGTSGQSYWDRKLNGNLDEVSLYNRALATNEIAAIYASGSGGKCKGAAPPVIVAQPHNQTWMAGGTANFSVTALGSPPLFYRWYLDGFPLNNDVRISGATNPALAIINLQSSDIGNYQVMVSNSVGTVASAVASLNTGTPPTNDNFSAATVISGSTGSKTGNNANATKESGEPNHAGKAGGGSVWYNWTAPSASAATFDTAMSAFDTLLAVYTGSSVSGLTMIASNDNASPNNIRSRVTFTPVAGTVYHIAVDGANGANGNFTLRWAQASTPLPDLTIVASALNPRVTTETFSMNSCAVVEGLIQPGTRTLIRFDTETENSGTADLVFGNPSANPLFVWAACHAHYHFQNYMAYRLRDTSGNLVRVGLKVGFCVLDVFRWSSSGANNAKYTCNNQGIQIGWGDLYDSTLDGQWIDITGLPAGNYVMEVEANPLGIIQEANYGNNLIQVPFSIGNPNAPPNNDNFASSQALLGGFASVVGTTVNGTKQAGEPNHAGNAGGHSIWYNWNSPSTKAVSIDTFGSSFNTLLAVYTGSAVNALTLLTNNDDAAVSNPQSRVSFNAIAGTTYQIAVDGFNGAVGNVVLTLNQTIQNDNFLSCQYIGGVGGVVYGSNAGATKEAGEPDHGGNPGGASIWYCWTAPIGGTATFDTQGSTFNTLLAIYSGTALNNLTLLANNDDITPGSILQSRASFSAVGLNRYFIAIDGYNGDTGDTTLNWTLTGTGGAVALSGVVDKNGALAPGGATLKYAFLPEGEFQLGIEGEPQQHYRIERSCDLVHWLPLVTTLSDFNGKAWFVDKAVSHLKSASGDPVCGPGQVVGVPVSTTEARFYRAIAVGGN